ncbi:unnamed protein product [Brassicogethes aeneus]|uniref:Methyltransferase-like protein 4 n=1 Tax=Brassicogethes aeneus TaxID=1431903 RepID=A0A9P0BBJ7_BRAAE|nr:unnamed protein product [Brassicogethes aeneus]
MSILFKDDHCFFICHKHYIDKIYKKIQTESLKSYKLKEDLFNITTPYKASRSNYNNEIDPSKSELEVDICYVRDAYKNFQDKLYKQDILSKPMGDSEKNIKAKLISDNIYLESTKYNVKSAFGENLIPAVREVNGSNFLFPEKCLFYSFDVNDIDQRLNDKKFDLILLDPPWWNKYIRRKRKKSDSAYHMMYNDDLKNIPIEVVLKESGLVVVWCTNSQQNLDTLINDIFKKWNVDFITKWYWLKITRFGEPICSFSKPPGKQPFEQIIIGGRNIDFPQDFNKKVIVSIPSAIHSHKPPLEEILKFVLPENAEKLEIFARYLLNGWTSYGNEVLKLQNEILFDVT